MRIDRTQLSGAVVRRTFSGNGKQYRAGDELSSAELRALPEANLRALIENEYVQIYPASADVRPRVRIMKKVAEGKFHVFEGRYLTNEPVSREKAETLIKASGD